MDHFIKYWLADRKACGQFLTLTDLTNTWWRTIRSPVMRRKVQWPMTNSHWLWLLTSYIWNHSFGTLSLSVPAQCDNTALISSSEKMSRTSSIANSSSLGRSDCGQFSSLTDYIHFDGQFNHLSEDGEAVLFTRRLFCLCCKEQRAKSKAQRAKA